MKPILLVSKIKRGSLLVNNAWVEIECAIVSDVMGLRLRYFETGVM